MLSGRSSKACTIERFNLGQQPLQFANNTTVKGFLQRSGEESLPLILVDGEVALAGRYPSRAELTRWAGLAAVANQEQDRRQLLWWWPMLIGSSSQRSASCCF